MSYPRLLPCGFLYVINSSRTWQPKSRMLSIWLRGFHDHLFFAKLLREGLCISSSTIVTMTKHFLFIALIFFRGLEMDLASAHGEDRISDLHNHLLCHILSFLPTKSSVASSCLSTRWRYVWTSTPILDVDARQHRDFCPILNLNFNRESEVMFQNFVNRVLLLNDTPKIEKFRLIYECHYNPGAVRTWFNIAITHKIQELELDLFSSIRREFVKLPRKLFTSNFLVVLKLSRMPLDIPSFVYLPRLKILELKRIPFLDDKSIQSFLSGCKILEELVIEETAREKPRVVHISISTLKSISFSYKFVINITVDCPYKFVFNAPCLEYFHVKGRLSDDFLIKSSSTMICAHLDLRYTGVRADDYIFCHERVCKLFEGISNVKFLTLSGDLVQLLCVAHEKNLPGFTNLRTLAFGVGFDFCWKSLVIKFIKHSAQLEEITLNNKQGLLRDTDELWKNPPGPIPQHLVSWLKDILIEELYSSFIPEAVEYLVQEVNILKKLKMKCQCSIMLKTQIDYA